MKRNALIYSALTLMLVLITATSALAVFPSIKPGLHPTLGDGCITIPIQQGWFDDLVAWYFCTDTNNVRYATTQKLTLAPELSSALGNGARKMYVVLNYNNSGPVFDTAPTFGPPTYSGLWKVLFVKWKTGPTIRPHVIKNTDPESITNPFGLPGSSKIEIKNTPFDVNDPDERIVVDCPIVALGSLGYPKGNPQLGGVYRIPQIIALNNMCTPKTITLPTWNVYNVNNISQKIEVATVIIPDVEDPDLATLLKANLAPGLAHVPFDDTQLFWVIDWMQPNGMGGVFVVPPAQLPIVEQCVNSFGWGCPPLRYPFSWQNTNFLYTPICQFTLLDRFFDPICFPGFTDKVTIKTPEFIEILTEDGLLEVIFEGTKINAPQVPWCDLPRSPG